MASATLRLVHLVGSIPLATTEEVFIQNVEELPGLIKYVPDGEIGERNKFVWWQSQVFPQEILCSPFMSPEAQSQADPNFSLKLEDVKSTGYVEPALASYQSFLSLRRAGTIPANIRFQVSLPTPMNSIACWVHPAHATKSETFYEIRIMETLKAIQQGIPASDLAIQWDMAVEPGHMEHAYGRSRPDFTVLKPWYSPVDQGIASRTVQLVEAVDREVKMGFHLCYGDLGHVHYVQPDDIGILVALANLVYRTVAPIHSVDWIHMPVPKDRTDETYFAPLRGLEIGPQTDLVLGLVHPEDEEGTRKRVEEAGRALGGGRRFGVATECGLGRMSVKEGESVGRSWREVTE